MKKMILFCLIFIGCASIPTYFTNDETLQLAGGNLVTDYLNGQINGEHIIEAAKKYGSGVATFKNIHEWRAEYAGFYKYNKPAIFCRIKAENSFGAVLWEDIVITFSYDPILRKNGDKYLGLRIIGVDYADLSRTVNYMS